jgi:glycosyltransferase involved in cell wall biosynthesis
MRILQICSATEMGGGEFHVADLTRSLVQRGHTLHLAVRPGSPLPDVLAGIDVTWHELPLRNSVDLQSVRAIAGIAVEHSMNIIHGHVARDYLVAAMACRRLRRTKLVLTRHHYLPLSQNAAYKWLLQDVAAFIAVSASVRDSIIARLRLAPERVHIIPNWIDPGRLQTVERKTARESLNLQSRLGVACIGEVTRAKGIEDFIRAAGRVARSRTDVDFLIAGQERDPEQPFTSDLKELAERLGITSRVRFLGHVDNVPELLAAVDVVVVPSWDEGFSLVTLESLAARRAVVASDVGGIRDIVQDNITGMLFPPKDANTLANKLLWVLSDTPLRERLGNQGQQDVTRRFARDQVIDRIEALYNEVLQSPKK